MTSIGPYDSIHEMNHMWDFTDLRGKFPINAWRVDSIMGTLKRLRRFSKYLHILKIAQMEHKLDHTLCSSTLFVVSDDKIDDSFLQDMDRITAKGIINSFSINGKLYPEFLVSTPISYYQNKHNDHLLITNVNNKTFVNQTSSVLSHYIADNGVIYELDSFNLI